MLRGSAHPPDPTRMPVGNAPLIAVHRIRKCPPDSGSPLSAGGSNVFGRCASRAASRAQVSGEWLPVWIKAQSRFRRSSLFRPNSRAMAINSSLRRWWTQRTPTPRFFDSPLSTIVKTLLPLALAPKRWSVFVAEQQRSHSRRRLRRSLSRQNVELNVYTCGDACSARGGVSAAVTDCAAHFSTAFGMFEYVRANSQRLSFSSLDHKVTSRSPLNHALASAAQLTTACALHLGAFALSQRGEEALCSAVLCDRSLSMHACDGDRCF
ncbi:hypothetical protein ACLKA7_005609 [Drosophila subpalustris]